MQRNMGILWSYDWQMEGDLWFCGSEVMYLLYRRVSSIDRYLQFITKPLILLLLQHLNLTSGTRCIEPTNCTQIHRNPESFEQPNTKKLLIFRWNIESKKCLCSDILLLFYKIFDCVCVCVLYCTYISFRMSRI